VKYLSKNGSVKNKTEEKGRDEKCKGSLNTYGLWSFSRTFYNRK